MSSRTAHEEKLTTPADRAALFSALGAESRVRIIELLSGDTLCVAALAHLAGISAGAVSQHLRVLRSAGLVESERHGYYVHYRLAPGAAKLLRAAVAALTDPEAGRRARASLDRCLRTRNCKVKSARKEN